ncbi:uncharacterized protein [Cardiocondyla obscurior]|uniref:uncharacterized protein n=1 Tax=Cardiocondyla obscurior TaxID=286306 RepID=UPI0039657182
MHSRNVTFIIDEETTVKRTIHKGLPQGAVLSPILYNIYTTDITRDLPSNIKHAQFADDIAIWCYDSDPMLRKINIEKAIDILNKELNNIGLNLQSNKTNLIEFHRESRCQKNKTTIRCINDQLTLKKEAKFLGITFDCCLNFNNQCNKIKEKANKINGLFRFLNKISRGIEVNTALMLYKSLMRALIDYGSFIFTPNNNSRNRMMLEKIQYAGIRSALGYRNSTPTNVMIAEAKVTSIKERAKMLAKNFIIKNISQGESNLVKEIAEGAYAETTRNLSTPWRKSSILTEIFLKCDKYRNILSTYGGCPIFYIGYWDATESLNIDCDIARTHMNNTRTPDINIIIEEIKRNYNLEEDCIMIYTDGSRKENKISTGSAFYVESIDMCYSLSLNKLCNNFSAEACAISEALKWCILKDIKEDIIIFTDSLSVLEALRNNKLGSNINEFIIHIRVRYLELLRESSRSQKKIILAWIPAHKGIYGNEIADTQAKEATSEEHSQLFKVPFGDFKEIHKQESFMETNKEIKQQFTIKGKFYYDNFYDENIKYPWFKSLNLPRRFIVLINRLRAYHYNLNSSLSRKGYIDSARCECGAEEQDINHIVFSCKNYDDQRQKLYDELNKVGNSKPECVWSWLKKEELTTLKAVFHYIVDIKRVI